MIRFSTNWEKLGWTIFTTIRKNTHSKLVGQIHTIRTPDGDFKAKIIGLYPIKKIEITDDLAFADADMTKDGLIRLLEGWYGKEFDDYVLITLWAI